MLDTLTRGETMAAAWRLQEAHNTDGTNIEGHNWFLGSGWQLRTIELFELAGKVQRRTGRPAGN